MLIRINHFPVLPNPPSPLSVSLNSETISKLIGPPSIDTNWNSLWPRLIVNGVFFILSTAEIISPLYPASIKPTELHCLSGVYDILDLGISKYGNPSLFSHAI